MEAIIAALLSSLATWLATWVKKKVDLKAERWDQIRKYAVYITTHAETFAAWTPFTWDDALVSYVNGRLSVGEKPKPALTDKESAKLKAMFPAPPVGPDDISKLKAAGLPLKPGATP